MTLLQELLESAKESKFDEQVKIVCDKIIEEEGIVKGEEVPYGSNIFLALPIMEKLETPHFMVLEREFPEKFIVKLMKWQWRDKKHVTMKAMEVNEGKPENVMKKFAQLYNHFNGV